MHSFILKSISPFLVLLSLLSSNISMAYYPHLCVLAEKGKSCQETNSRFGFTYTAPNSDWARTRCKKKAKSRKADYCFFIEYFDASNKKCINDDSDLRFECEIRVLGSRRSQIYYKNVKASSDQEAIEVCRRFSRTNKDYRFFDKVLAKCK